MRAVPERAQIRRSSGASVRLPLCRPLHRTLRNGTAAARAQAHPSPDPGPLFSKLSVPVYSLSTASSPDPSSSQGPLETLNLVTYAAPISIQPRRFALGLYIGTLSHDNFRQTNRGVLQVLRKRHAPLFHLLGKTSGRTTDKVQAVQEQGFKVVQRYGLPTLADAACVMELRAASEFINCGDHDVVICDVVSYENIGSHPTLGMAADGAHVDPMGMPTSTTDDEAAPEGQDVLYTGDLRHQGYMSS